MSWWKYKSLEYVKWVEPVEFTKFMKSFENGKYKWIGRIIVSILVSCLLFIPIYIGSLKRLGTSVNIWVMVAGTLALVFFVSYLAFIGGNFTKYKISLGKTAIIKAAGVSVFHWKYEQIKSAFVGKQKIKDKSFLVLLITLIDSHDIIFGVSNKVDLNLVIKVLEDKNIQVQTN